MNWDHKLREHRLLGLADMFERRDRDVLELFDGLGLPDDWYGKQAEALRQLAWMAGESHALH